MGHRLEDPKQRTFAIDDSTEVAIGDMLFLDTDDVKSASVFPWDTDLETTQKAFSKVFVGVSADRKGELETEVNEIGVYRAGLIEFSCDPTTFEIGDLIGVAQASGDALENQKVVAVTGASKAIGKVAKRYSSNTTSVICEIFPKKSSGQLSIEDIQDELGALEASSISADAIVDGSTNKAYTATEKTKLENIEAFATADQTGVEIVTLLEALAPGDKLCADAIINGSTNKAYTAGERIKIETLPTKSSMVMRAVTADEESADLITVAMGLGEQPTGYIVQILRSGVVLTGYLVSAVTTGVTIATTAPDYDVTENDVVSVIAWVANP